MKLPSEGVLSCRWLVEQTLVSSGSLSERENTAAYVEGKVKLPSGGGLSCRWLVEQILVSSGSLNERENTAAYIEGKVKAGLYTGG